MARTNIVIDDGLINRVIKLTGAKSKREAVDIALRQYVAKTLLFQDIKKFEGRLSSWSGNLDQLRKNRR